MSSHTTSLANIPLLQGTMNYADWALKIKATAQLGKFWRAFTDENKPVDSSATSAKNAANRKEAALGLIKKTVIKTIVKELHSIPDPSDSEKTITNGTANQLWKYLETTYSKKEGITSFYEYGALFCCDLVDDGTLEQQINKLSDMRSIYAQNDFNLHDWQFAILVLHALPPSYKHIPDNMLVAGKFKLIRESPPLIILYLIRTPIHIQLV